MDSYQILLFLHVSSVIVWVGAELLIDIVAFRVDRQGETALMTRLFEEVNALDPVFIPAVVVAPVTGILLVVDGPWSFGAAWVVLGLAGFGLVVLYGFLYLEPQVKRARAMIERGGMEPQADALVRRFFVLWRIETVVLFLVVFAMTTKPTGDDVGTLAGMAAVFAAAAAYLFRRAWSIDVTGTEAREAA